MCSMLNIIQRIILQFFLILVGNNLLSATSAAWYARANKIFFHFQKKVAFVTQYNISYMLVTVTSKSVQLFLKLTGINKQVLIIFLLFDKNSFEMKN